MASRKSPLWVPERGEIIFVDHSPHVGKEMPHDHPMLVASTKEFADKTGIVMGFPMTHAEFHTDNPFAIVAPGANGATGYVLVNQPKSFDWRARNARPHSWGTGHHDLLNAALRRFDAIFSVCNH